MAVSGSYDLFSADARFVIERAYARCKRKPSDISAEDLINARFELDVLLKELVADGINLWCLEDVVIPLYPDQRIVDVPAGTHDVLDPLNLRTVSNLGADVVSSSAGGDVTKAFDDDVETSLTQTSANGSILATLSDPLAIPIVGILPAVTASWNLAYEVAGADQVFRTVYQPGAATFTDRRWTWIEIPRAESQLYFKIRETGGGTLSIRELVLGYGATELPVTRENVNDYLAMPTKYQPTNRPVIFWFDRQRDATKMDVWPPASSIYQHLTGKRQRLIYDVGPFTNAIDVPSRWLRAIITGLAGRIAETIPDLDEKRIVLIKASAKEALDFVDDDERDRSPIEIDFGIRGYTR